MGPDEATNRRGGGGDGGEGEEKGEEGGQAIQLKPASKCSYCFLGFAHECETTLRRLPLGPDIC